MREVHDGHARRGAGDLLDSGLHPGQPDHAMAQRRSSTLYALNLLLQQNISCGPRADHFDAEGCGTGTRALVGEERHLPTHGTIVYVPLIDLNKQMGSVEFAFGTVRGPNADPIWPRKILCRKRPQAERLLGHSTCCTMARLARRSNSTSSRRTIATRGTTVMRAGRRCPARLTRPDWCVASLR